MNTIAPNTMKALTFALLLVLALPGASLAELKRCPKNGRVYDTSHGYYVDVPNTDYYVPAYRRDSVR